AHAAVFSFAEPLADGTFTLKMLFERHFSAGLGKFRIAVTTDAQTPVARDWPHEVEQLLLVPDEKLTPAEREKLQKQFLLVTPELKAAHAEIDALRKQLPPYPTTLVMAERSADNRRPTFIHNRGEFLQPADQVEPAIPAWLPPLPRDA